jgi:hypothetical protein
MDSLTRPEGTEPEDLHIGRRAAVTMFFAGYAVAALAADAKPIRTPDAGLTIAEVLIPNGAAKPLPAYVARPKGNGRHATIIVVNEIFGIHDYIKDICRRLAKLGYVAVAPDFFYRAGVNLPAISDFKQIMPIVAQAGDDQVDGDVTGQVVDAVERLVQREGQRLGRRQPDHQRAHQPRPGGDGDAVDLGQVDAGRLLGPTKGRQQRLQVRPAGHLRHHAAEADVLGHAGGHLVGQQLGAAHHPDPGLVTGGLDAQDQRPAHGALSFVGVLRGSGGVQLGRSHSRRISACRPGP